MKTVASQKSGWLVNLAPRESPQIRLFAFPFAGGGASAYREWHQNISLEIEVIALNYPGRDSRINETPIKSMPQLVDSICEAIKEQLNIPFAFFGYSMGGTVAFEVARKVRSKMNKSPQKFIVAASKSPICKKENQIHKLNDESFVDVISSYGGIPEQILRHKDLIKLFLPALRADIYMFETYSCQSYERMNAPVVACLGQADRFVTEEHMKKWAEFTSIGYSQYEFSGGHFFISENRDMLLQVVQKELCS